jgi:hypothetical protein
MRATIDGKDHVDVAEAVELTGYTPEYIRRLIRREKLEGIKRGTMWFVTIESLQAYKRQMDSLGDEKFSPWRD